MTQTRRRGERPLWAHLGILFFTLLAIAGCGDSNNDFVVTGNNINPNPNNDPGTLTFQFFKPQADFAAEVPTATTDLRFDYIDTDGDVINSDIVDYAETVTVTPPAGTVTVRITAIAANGFPLFQLQGAVATPAVDTNVNVDLTNFTGTDITFNGITVTPDPTAVTAGVNVGNTQQLTVTAAFSNNQNIVFNNALLAATEFDVNGSTNYTVNDTGLVTAVVAGPSTLTASYTDTEGLERSDTISVNVTGGVIPPLDVLVVTPDTLNIPINGSSAPVTATLNGDVIVNNLLTFSIVDATPGFSVDAAGVVTVAGDVVDGTPATLLVALTSDPTVTDTVALTANTALVVSRQIASPTADPITLPYQIDFQVVVSETFDNGQTTVVADPAAAGYTFDVNNGASNASVTAGGLVSTGTNTGTADIDLIFNAAVVDDFDLDVDNTEAPTSLDVQPELFELTPGRTQSYTVTADFNDLADVDVTNSPNVTFNPNNNAGDSEFNLGTANGGSSLDSDTWTGELLGATDVINVDVALGFITSLDITIGEQATGNIPFLLDGVVEVNANLLDGRTQRLFPNQFTIAFEGADNDFFTINGSVLRADGGNNNASVGSSQAFNITVTDVNYPWASGVADTTPAFTGTYVTSGGASSATANFSHYPDVNAIFTARRTNNTEDQANLVPRALDLFFSNGSVENFRVAAANASSSANFYTIDEDIFGYPCLTSDVNTISFGSFGTSTMEVRNDNGELLKAAAFQAVRVLNRNIIGNSGTSAGQAYVLPFQSVSILDTETFEYQVDARPTVASANEETFTMTAEFSFEPDDPYRVSAVVTGGDLLEVTGLSTAGNAFVQVFVQAVSLIDLNAPGNDLDITVTDN